MTPFLIHYLHADGRRARVTVRARDKAHAREVSGVAEGRIEKVTPDYLGLLFNRPPPPQVQILVLSQLGAFAASGNAMGAALSQLSAHKSLTRRLSSLTWTTNEKVSTLLEQLDFDPAIPPLVAAGESAGRLPEQLGEAAQYLAKAQEIRRGVSLMLYVGLAMLAISAIALVAMPGFMGGQLDRFNAMGAAGLHLDTGLATTLLLGWRDLLEQHHWALLALLLLGTGLAWRFRDQVPGFSAFVALKKARRSAVLVSVLRPLLKAGIRPKQIHRILVTAVGESARDLTAKMHGGTEMSVALAASSRWWSPTLVATMRGFETIHATGRDSMLNMLLLALNEEQQAFSAQGGRSVWIAGGTLSALLMYLIAAGYLLPLMGMSR